MKRWSVGRTEDAFEYPLRTAAMIELAYQWGFELTLDESVAVRFMYDPECDEATKRDCIREVFSDEGGIADRAAKWLTDEVVASGWEVVFQDPGGRLTSIEWVAQRRG